MILSTVSRIGYLLNDMKCGSLTLKNKIFILELYITFTKKNYGLPLLERHGFPQFSHLSTPKSPGIVYVMYKLHL